jgi:hypothetical protein
MNTTLTAFIVLGCLIAAVLVGRTLRSFLPEDYPVANSDVSPIAVLGVPPVGSPQSARQSCDRAKGAL